MAVGVLTRQGDDGHDDEHELHDGVIDATRRYPRTAQGVIDAEAAWDEMLTVIDDLLLVRRARHLEAVRAARAGQAQR